MTQEPKSAVQLRVRRGFGHRVVFAVFAVTVLLAFAGGVDIYFKYVAYGRVAARHLPGDTRLAARIDVETVLVSQSLSKHLLPLFDQGVRIPAGFKPRHERFLAHSGVEFGRDLREIVLGLSDTGWVVVFGGKFPKSGLVANLETTLREEAANVTLKDGLLQVAGGPAIGQASDGALVIASDAVRLRDALLGSDAYIRLALPPEGAGGFAYQVGPAAPLEFRDFERVSGAVELGKTVSADVVVRLRAGKTATPAMLAASFAALGRAAPADSLLRRPLETAQILHRSPREATVRVVLQPAEFDAGLNWLASELATQFARLPGAS